MWFTCLRTIRGWSTEVPSWRGRDGTRTPEFGLAVRTSPSESASESAGTGVLGGAGAIGDSIGTTDTHCTTTAGTTPRAGHFITATTTTEVEAHTEAEAHTEVGAAEFTTIRGQRPDLSRETGRRLEDTRNRAVRAASAPALSVAMTMVERPEAIRHAEAPASVAAGFTAEVAGAGNRSFRRFIADHTT